MDRLLDFVRGLHFASSLLAAGAVIFLVLNLDPVASPRPAQDETQLAIFARLRRRTLICAWWGIAFSILTGFAWFVLVGEAMSDQGFASFFTDGAASIVLTQTDFGNDWLLRGAIIAAFAALLARESLARETFMLPARRPFGAAALLLLAAAFVGSLAWAGHAVGAEGIEGVIHPAADALHLVAAAAWVGTLLPLALVLAALGNGEPAATRRIVERYSTLGLFSVAAILASGAINTWYLAGSVAALTDTVYGRLVLGKVALFAGMVAVAAVNRFWLTPRIDIARTAASASSALRRNVAVEIALGVAVLAIVAVLGRSPPAAHLEHHHHAAEARFVRISGAPPPAPAQARPRAERASDLLPRSDRSRASTAPIASQPARL